MTAGDPQGMQDEAPQGAQNVGPAPATDSPEDDPIVVGAAEAAEESLIARLNPRRLFRRRTAESFVKEGRDLLENGSLAQAIVAFNRAISMDPRNVSAYRGLGKVYFKRGGRSNLEQALRQYQAAIKLAPMDHDLYAITAKIYDALGKRKEATLERKKFVIVRALEADDKNPVANNNMGILFLQQGRVDTALDYFRKAVRSDRNFDVAHRNLAATYYQQAKHANDAETRADLITRAREEVESALKIQRSVPSLLAYGRILLQQGEAEEALAAASEADSMDAANKEVYLLKKMALERLGRLEEARNAQESYQVFLQAERQGGGESEAEE